MSPAPPTRARGPVRPGRPTPLTPESAPPLRTVRTTGGTLLAIAGALVMGLTARSMAEEALTEVGPSGLLSALLAAVAILGTLLCLYLAVIWGSTMVLIAGPSSTLARALLPALRVLAPRLTRQLVLGAGTTAAVAGLTLSGATAAVLTPGPETTQSSCAPQAMPSTAQALTAPSSPSPGEGGGCAGAALAPAGSGDAAGRAQTPAEAAPSPTTPAGTPAETTPSADAGTEATPREQEDLPSLGWEGTPSAPDPTAPAEPAEPTEAAPTEPAQATPDAADSSGTGDAAPSEDGAGDEEPTADAPRTIVVREGDTLWSLTDRLLGDGPDSDAEIAAAWPDLYQHNHEVIGDDPDLLRPGQVLSVPAGLDQQEQR